MILTAAPAGAVELSMPLPAVQTFAEAQPLASHRVATGPMQGSALPVEVVEGSVTRRVHQLAAGQATTLQMLSPLRDALLADGWEAGFSCETRVCGGFDFRFALDVVPAPEMFVDLADFRYATFLRGEEWFTMIVSRSGAQGYVQTTHVGAPGSVEAVTKSSAAVVPPPGLAAVGEIGTALAATGRAVLDDLVFPTGSTELPEADYASLAALADFLRANPSATVALVGHTDAEGGAEGNMAISRRRADSARAILVDGYGIAPNRVETFGVGFFAPVARNDTEAGRSANRRVEVVVTSVPE
ncbi:OmpA family protein [Jannaschia aquimarina]|uniref:OmpA family protein n=1 Tax=Jannaschia aquimarina TaxID=935700 RepID=UPI0006975EE0|nr:OmpA family protein [Jannaschia aquimarina]